MRKQVLALLLLSGSLAFAATPPTPIQAELVKAIEAGHIKPGDPILARVEIEWKNSQCLLRKGATLKGRIVAENERTKTTRNSRIALLFESGECNGKDMKSLPLTVAAMVAPNPRDTSLFNDEQTQPLADAVGLGIDNGLRSATQAAQTVIYEPTQNHPQQAVMPGQVVGIHDVKLSVGTGPEGSSVLIDDRHNLRLETGSQFVLVPNVKAEPSAKLVPAAAVTAKPDATQAGTPAVPEFKDTTEVCEPPNCSIAATISEAASAAPGASTVISIKSLGHVASPNRDMYHFDREAALTYLGENQLLFTFNPHELISRVGMSGSWRTIRSVLIDIKKQKIERVEDWQIPDWGQYLWPMAGNQVLAHVGKQLRVYGPGLKLQRFFTLNGPLAFVAVSPSSKYFAVGVMQERHTPAIHQQLEDAEGREPEEDVEVRVLDANFRQLAKVMRSSLAAQPVLSDDGEIRIPTIGKNRWRIVEHTWGGQRRVLAEVSSSCRVEAKSLPPGLLFITGCEENTGTWYRMLSADGKPVLKGRATSEEIEQLAEGQDPSGVFAVAVTKASKSIAHDATFRGSDLEDEHIVVYRASNGRKLFATDIPSPTPTSQTFGISPSGDQLAVFKNDGITFYAMPSAGTH